MERILTRNIDKPNSTSIDVYEAGGGYQALRKAVKTMTPDAVTDEVKKNGLGAVDAARLASAIDQIGLTFQFAAKPTAEAAFDSSFLPDAAERAIE